MKHRILVVDDDTSVLQSFEQILGGQHQVVTAMDGAEGEELMDQARNADVPFDLLISDVNMPIIGGIELISWVKSNTSDTPCILISSGPDPKFHKADVFISKLISPEELGSVVANLLKRGMPAPRG